MKADPTVSPCTGLCTLDAAGELCTGCARRPDEIAAWGTAPAAVRAEIWARLPARRAALGIRLHRLAWGPVEIRAHIRASLAGRRGTWVIGARGALAELSVGGDEPVEVDVSGPVVTGVTPRGALRLTVPDGVRALAADPPTATGALPTVDEGGRGPVLLVTARPVRPRPPRRSVTALGPDEEAVRPEGRGLPRFDLGLGSQVSRFCVRTDHGGLLTALRAAEGRPWTELVASVGPLLRAVSPDRVVESALGRIEVAAPIRPPGGRSPEGPHTHLLPELLAAGGDPPAGVALPAGWLPGATWYPAPPGDAG